MKLRYKAGAIASAMAIAAGLGVAFAGPAAAIDETQLCIRNATYGTIVCAFSSQNQDAPVVTGGYPGGSPWDVPTSGTHQIGFYNDTPTATWCMELNASGGNTIRMATCAGKASEEWSAVTTSVYIGQWVTAYYYVNSYNPALCLTAPPASGQLTGSTCDFNNDYNQEWFFKQP